MLECGFESLSELEYSAFSMCVCGGGGGGGVQKLVFRRFLRVLRFAFILHHLMILADEIKLKTDVISTLSRLFAELSLPTTRL